MLHELINGTLKIFKAVFFHASLSSLFCWSLVKTGRGRGSEGPVALSWPPSSKAAGATGTEREEATAERRSDQTARLCRYALRHGGKEQAAHWGRSCCVPHLVSHPSADSDRFNDTAAWSASYHTHMLWLMFILKLECSFMEISSKTAMPLYSACKVEQFISCAVFICKISAT